jgi:prostaglandin-E synthase 1
MDNWLNSPSFVAYAVMCVVLCLNMLGLWGYSGAVRAKTKTAINHEDAARFGSSLEQLDPPEVARVLRAHGNAQANIYPFLILGLVFVLAGGAAGTARILFGIFVVARLAHSFVYLAGKQPWRTIIFIVGLLATGALTANVAWLIAKASLGS